MPSGPTWRSCISIFSGKFVALERELAGDLVQTPYVRLLAIPGINVVSAAELAGEMGPITRYANANAITGRAGLYPSRHQSDQTDNDSGPIIRQANRRIAMCADADRRQPGLPLLPTTVDWPTWIEREASISEPAE